MSWISDLIGSSVGTVISKIGGIVDDLTTTDEEKQLLKLKMAELVLERDKMLEASMQAEINAKKEILVAELTQGDNYTKRARPTVVYAGLGMIFINYCIMPIAQTLTGADMSPIQMPDNFWWAWGGTISVWSIGRTMERRGIKNKTTDLITGSSGL